MTNKAESESRKHHPEEEKIIPQYIIFLIGFIGTLLLLFFKVFFDTKPNLAYMFLILGICCYLIDVFIYHETITWQLLLGVLLVVGGVFVVSLK